MRAPCAILGLLGLALTAPLAAQQHPSSERGFDPEKVYQFSDLDSVNLLNGNVGITIPLGQKYPVGGGLSYGLSIVYNSKVWDHQEAFYQGKPYSQALPDRLSNAGMGWTISLGRLLSPTDPLNDYRVPWVYIGPDGADHGFYADLHDSGQAGVDPCGAVCYTRDGSYIRMTTLSSIQRMVELPDGTRHIFTLLAIAGGISEWRPTEIRDRYEDGLRDVEISYPDRLTSDLVWEIRDKHNRLHTVTFESDTSGRYRRRVKYVDVAAFGAGAPPSRYTFSYLDQTVNVPCSSNLPFWNTVRVPFLSSLFLPDGTTYGMMYYHPTDGGDCRARSMLSDLFLPTLGKIHYYYRLHTLPIRGCSSRAWHSYSAGIATRQFLGAAGEDLGTWTYTSSLSNSPWPPTAWQCDDGRPFVPPSEQLTVQVVTPLKDKSLHYFSVFPGTEFPSTSAFDPLDYGLPFGKIPPPDATGTRFLSTQTFDCDESTGACPGTPARSTYARYERDASVRCGIEFGPECFASNRRLASQRTVYNDGKFADSDSSDFDGFGHYRNVTATGNFTADDARTTFTNFNPGNVLPGAAWVLGTHTEQWVQQAGVRAKTQLCFDGNTGFLRRKRVYRLTNADPLPASNDVLALYTVDAGSGNMVREESYGGDKAPQALSTSTNLCGLGLPAAGSEYRVDHTYQFGSLATSTYVDAAGAPLSFKTLDQTIDQKTGLTASGRDTAGIQTDYTYDAMGRLRTVRPQWTPTASWTDYTYTVAQGSLPARVDVRRCSNVDLVNCSPLTHHQVEYDALGRVAKEKQLLMDGTWSKRLTRYNGGGWKSQVSELEPDGVADGSLRFTTYAAYDPFGRAATVTGPDGHTVSFSFSGESSTTRTFTVGTEPLDANGNVPQTPVSVTDFLDRHGRLWKVRETSSPSGTNVTTEYSYDVGNRVGVVKTTAPEATQLRFFGYDGRGFLTGETHPEKGGQIKYSRYDSRGHVGQEEDVAGSGPNLFVYSYDRAERLVEIRKDNFSGPLLKKFTHATAASSCGLCNGKLQQARRYNYHTVNGTPFEVVIEENYTYGARGGLVSTRDLKLFVNGTQFETFTQGFDYNQRGAVSTNHYPQCTHLDCTSDNAAQPRTVTRGTINGFLSWVTGFTGTVPGQPAGYGFTYHANGMVAQIQHGNGVLDTYAVDTGNWMRRPLSISTSGANLNWSSGAYRYDGAGNVLKTGTDWFQYDRVSRLKKGVVHADSSGAGGAATERVQSYVYDTYGNVLSITTAAGGGTVIRGTPTSAASNRLTGAVGYDTAGNLTSWNGTLYTYDAFNQMTRLTSPSEDTLYSYTADDERVWSYNLTAGASRWTLRDLDQRVLREYSNNGGFWTVANDYVYRDGVLLAAVKPGQPAVHFSVDHLGTPRLITDGNRNRLAYHVYYPFGEEATTFNQDVERLKFTGHERDLNNLFGPDDDLDYMHARFCSPQTARFLAVDPAGGDAGKPQSWNRYAYVQDNPLLYTDPNGKVLGFGFQAAEYLDSKIEQAESFLFSLTPGGGAGIMADTQIGVTADLARSVTDLLRVGHASGEALGSGAGALETSLALGGDTLRVAAIAAPLAGAGRSVAARTLAREAGAVDASAFVGRRSVLGGQGAHTPQLRNAPYQPVRNAPGRIGGRQYSGHAFDQMQNRGLTPSVVENTLKVGQRTPGNQPGTLKVFDVENNVTVILNARGAVITVY